MNIIKIFDGYKTIIGAVVMSICYVVEQFYEGAGWSKPEVVNGILSALYALGQLIAGTGIGHKILKANNMDIK